MIDALQWTGHNKDYIPRFSQLSNVMLDIHEVITCLKLPISEYLTCKYKGVFLQDFNILNFPEMQLSEKMVQCFGNVCY